MTHISTSTFATPTPRLVLGVAFSRRYIGYALASSEVLVRYGVIRIRGTAAPTQAFERFVRLLNDLVTHGCASLVLVRAASQLTDDILLNAMYAHAQGLAAHHQIAIGVVNRFDARQVRSQADAPSSQRELFAALCVRFPELQVRLCPAASSAPPTDVDLVHRVPLLSPRERYWETMALALSAVCQVWDQRVYTELLPPSSTVASDLPTTP